MFPDAKWLDALKLPLKASIAGALATAALLWLDFSGLLKLGALGAITRPILIILVVVFTALSVVGIVDWLFKPLGEWRRQVLLKVRRAAKREEQKELSAEVRAQVLKKLDHLSKEEIDYVARALRAGSPTFYTYVFSPPVSVLQGKGLVWTPRRRAPPGPLSILVQRLRMGAPSGAEGRIRSAGRCQQGGGEGRGRGVTTAARLLAGRAG
jgi:hypothetical protein